MLYYISLLTFRIYLQAYIPLSSSFAIADTVHLKNTFDALLFNASYSGILRLLWNHPAG